MRPAACRSCGAPIVWVVSAKTGKSLPLDAVPVETGNVSIDDAGRAHVGKPKLPLETDDRYMSHFVTCPEAGEWRRA